MNLIGGVYESGALFSYEGSPSEINIRVGVSFVSADQACANAESEIGDASFEDIMAQSKALWNEKLSKIQVDLKNTPANITELLYSSLYRASLTPVSDEILYDSARLVTISPLRTMLPTRRKARSRAPPTTTSTRSTVAGTPSGPSTRS